MTDSAALSWTIRPNLGARRRSCSVALFESLDRSKPFYLVSRDSTHSRGLYRLCRDVRRDLDRCIHTDVKRSGWIVYHRQEELLWLEARSVVQVGLRGEGRRLLGLGPNPAL
jgi:hypothetical protein